ncbi:MAG: hypothetical protein K2Z81_02760 [Cyanobacteria bacterium]|nr:hypothetical protein [Cyanobacteriota bacterium]
MHCSFCGKSQDDVKKLIAGPRVYICDECIGTCNKVLGEEDIDWNPELRKPLFKAMDELLGMVLKTDNWIVTQQSDSSSGIRVLVGGNRVGSSLEEQLLYAAALESLVKENCLSQCGSDGNGKSTYQVTWKGLIQLRKKDASASNDK